MIQEYAKNRNFEIGQPPFNDKAVIKQLLLRINEIPGIHFDDDVLTKRARIPFDKLTTTEAVEKLKSAVAWLIEQVKAECESAEKANSK